MDRRIDSQSIRFLTTVVRALLGSHVGKPSSAYRLSGGFSPGSPVFAHGSVVLRDCDIPWVSALNVLDTLHQKQKNDERSA